MNTIRPNSLADLFVHILIVGRLESNIWNLENSIGIPCVFIPYTIKLHVQAYVSYTGRQCIRGEVVLYLDRRKMGQS